VGPAVCGSRSGERRRHDARPRGDSTAVEIPARKLADDAPLYSREAAEKCPPAPLDLARIPEADCLAALPALLAHPSIASKRWVWRQYDHMVRLGATVLPGSDAAVFIVREANKILAASTDCNAIYCRQDPREGAKIAVAEAARNIACTGAIPLALTDNLNFGNPHKPENLLQLREAVEGMAEACRKFDTPVTGGNVSLYNESPAGAIDPTPTVGMVGIVEDPKHVTTQFFKTDGDVIILIGEPGDELGASHYLLAIHGLKAGPPPRLDLRQRTRRAGCRALADPPGPCRKRTRLCGRRTRCRARGILHVEENFSAHASKFHPARPARTSLSSTSRNPGSSSP